MWAVLGSRIKNRLMTKKPLLCLNGSIIQLDWSCTSSAVKINCGLTCAGLGLLNAYVHCLCFRMWRKRKSCALISLMRRSERRSSSTTQTRVTTLKWHWWVNDMFFCFFFTNMSLLNVLWIKNSLIECIMN